MNPLRRLASQTAVYGLSSIIGRLLNWGLTPLYVNAFAPGEFGVFSDLYGLTFYAIVLLTFGLETAFFRFASEEYGARRVYTAAFWWIGVFSGGFLLLNLLTFSFTASLLGYGDRPVLILLLVGIIILDALAAMPMAKLRHDERAQRFASISLTNIGVTIVLNISFVYFLRLGVASVFMANLMASGIRTVMALEGNLPGRFVLDKVIGRPLLRYGGYIMAAGMAGALNETLDRNLLPRLWPDGQAYNGVPRTGMELNGIYSANYKLGMIVSLMTQAFRYAAEPFFFRRAKDKQSPALFAQVFHYFMLLCLVMFLVVSSFAHEIVTFNFWGATKFTLIPESYREGIAVVPIILLANICLAAYINLSIWFKLTGHLRFGLSLALFGAFLTVAINVILIPVYGYMACALATLVCYATMTALCYFLGQQFMPIPYRWKPLLIYGAAYFLLYRLCVSFGDGTRATLMRLLVVAVAVAATYAYERHIGPRLQARRA